MFGMGGGAGKFVDTSCCQLLQGDVTNRLEALLYGERNLGKNW